MGFNIKEIGLFVGFACFATGAALAAPPTAGAYVTDPQNEWVQDQLVEKISMPNTIMCFMSKLGADSMVNRGNYVALVDMNACESSNRGTDNSASQNAGADAATNYTRVVVNSSRASNNDAMVVNTWFVLEQGNAPAQTPRMFARATVTEAASATSPNGKFSVTFCGLPASQVDSLAGTCSMALGTLSSDGTTLSFAESSLDQNGAYTTRLAMNQNGSTSGSGHIAVDSANNANDVDLAFSYNATNFIRGTLGANQCFSRDRAQAKASTWRYGVYKSDGTRLEMTNPAFPITATAGGQTYWGQASFWGVFLPGTVLSQVNTVTRMTPGSSTGTDYNLTKAGGKLYKLTKLAGTLDSIKGQTFNTYLPNGIVAEGQGQYELSWDGSNLVAKRKQNNGTWTDLSSLNRTVLADTLRTNAGWQKALQGWSQSVGGELRIEVPAAGDFVAGTAIAMRTRELVSPSATTLNLGCINRCPKGGLAAGDFTAPGTPFQNITVNNWGGGGTSAQSSEFAFQPVAVGNVLRYTFGANGLLTTNPGGQAVDVSSLTLTGNYQWGFQSGRLVNMDDAAVTDAMRCDANNVPSATGVNVCPWLAENVTTFYTYETGKNNWNQYVGLTPAAGGAAVTFDPPRMLPLVVSTTNTDVPAGNALLGSTVQLQFSGFGELQGVPGVCVNRDTNLPGTCTGSNTQRWVPAFTIKDGTELSPDNGTTKYYVKYLEREIRFTRSPGACAALDLAGAAAMTLPATPTNANDPRTTLGAAPTVTAAPSVIQGVVQ